MMNKTSINTTARMGNTIAHHHEALGLPNIPIHSLHRSSSAAERINLRRGGSILGQSYGLSLAELLSQGLSVLERLTGDSVGVVYATSRDQGDGDSRVQSLAV